MFVKWWNNPGIYIYVYKWVGFVIPINPKQANVCLNICHSVKKQKKTSFGHWQMFLWGLLFHGNRQKNSRMNHLGCCASSGWGKFYDFAVEIEGFWWNVRFFKSQLRWKWILRSSSRSHLPGFQGFFHHLLGAFVKSWRLFFSHMLEGQTLRKPRLWEFKGTWMSQEVSKWLVSGL